jgi:hypothetical protein
MSKMTEAEIQSTHIFNALMREVVPMLVLASTYQRQAYALSSLWATRHGIDPDDQYQSEEVRDLMARAGERFLQKATQLRHNARTKLMGQGFVLPKIQASASARANKHNRLVEQYEAKPRMR